MKDELLKIIEGTVEKVCSDHDGPVSFSVEVPTEMSHGDYSTNVAMVLSKKIGKNPKEVAEHISEDLKSRDIPYFSKIEIAGPGFINFYLNKKSVEQKIKKANLENEQFGNNKVLRGKEILVEFTDPNLFKEFHIGHLMSNIIGESLCRIHEANGAKVHRLCYQSDVGMNVAKAVWGMERHKSAFPHNGDDLDDKIKFLGDSYVYGESEYTEDEGAQKEIKEINKKLFEKSDHELQVYYDKGREWSLAYFDEIYGKLGTNFERHYFESETGPVGKEIVMEYLKERVFEKSDGAIVYDGEKEGLHTRVFINSQGLPTYEAKDLGLATKKEEDFNYDASIILTGNEQKEYFKVLLSALGKVNKEIADKTISLTHGLMKIGGKKTSSRKGGVTKGMELIDRTIDLVESKLKDKNLSDDKKEEIKEIVAVGAVKYSILKQAIGKDIDYDFDKSVSFEGDSGPYIQYAYTRAKSALDKAKKEGIEYDETINSTDSWKTTDLERLIFQYEDVVKDSLKDLAPQTIVTYLTKLASEFNSFYASNKIVDSDDPDSSYKVSVAGAVKIILRHGLHVLGIKAPAKM